MTTFYLGADTLFTVESIPPDMPAKPEEVAAWEAAVREVKKESGQIH